MVILPPSCTSRQNVTAWDCRIWSDLSGRRSRTAVLGLIQKGLTPHSEQSANQPTVPRVNKSRELISAWTTSHKHTTKTWIACGITLTWCSGKYKVHKFHQGYIFVKDVILVEFMYLEVDVPLVGVYVPWSGCTSGWCLCTLKWMYLWLVFMYLVEDVHLVGFRYLMKALSLMRLMVCEYIHAT